MRAGRQRQREIARDVPCHHKPPHDLDAARADVESLLAFIVGRLDRGELFQQDLERGVNHVTVWKVLKGKSARPKTVRRIAIAAGVPTDLRNRAIRAAEVLHDHALSQGHHTRPPRAPAPLPAPPQPVPRDVRKQCTPRGLWLAERVYARFGSPEAFCRAAPMKRTRFNDYCFDGNFYPREATLSKIAATLSQRCDTVTFEDVLQTFGGRTFESYLEQDARDVAARRPPCPICGRAVPRQPSRRRSQHATCSYACDAVRRIVSGGIETELGQWLVAVMAAALDVPADKIARLLQVTTGIVTGWLREWGAPVEKIREALKASADRPHSLTQATAGVLGISRHPTLGALLHHRIRHPDRQHPGHRRTVAPAYLRGKTLAALAAFFGRSEKEILAAAGRSGGTMSDFYKTHGARASVQRKIFRRKTKGPSLKLNTHRAVQFILRAVYRGDHLDTIRETLDVARLPGSDDPMWTARQHAKTCTPCRALEAAWLHELQAKTNDEIGTLFGCSEAWAGTLVKRGLGAMHHPTPTLEKLLAKSYSIRVSEGPSI